MSDLTDITIAVTSFLRMGYLAECCCALTRHLPECPVLIADDSIPDPKRSLDYITVGTFEKQTYPVLRLRFDSGLSAKRNAIVRACETKYLLLYCDDFRADEECRAGILRALRFLDDRILTRGDAFVVGGRANNHPYECYLEYVRGEYIREKRAEFGGAADFCYKVDLTANYFLGVTEIMKRFPWPEEMKIGGEHVCFFLDLKLAGLGVWWMPHFNVKTMTLPPSAQDSRYPEFRARAFELGHQAMKRRYNIKKYIGMAGDVS